MERSGDCQVESGHEAAGEGDSGDSPDGWKRVELYFVGFSLQGESRVYGETGAGRVAEMAGGDERGAFAGYGGKSAGNGRVDRIYGIEFGGERVIADGANQECGGRIRDADDEIDFGCGSGVPDAG